MFKSRKSGGLQSKIAHTTILPALGNKDLRTLQDFITAEKGIVSGLQRLATDWGKAADALRTWGVGEGDDLGVCHIPSFSIIRLNCQRTLGYLFSSRSHVLAGVSCNGSVCCTSAIHPHISQECTHKRRGTRRTSKASKERWCVCPLITM